MENLIHIHFGSE